MAEEIIRFEEEDFISRLTMALNMIGFNTDVMEIEDFPISLEGDMIGYEDENVKFTSLFLPMEDTLGEEVQMLQIYISLFEDVAPACFVEAEQICNFYNMNVPLGIFGVQESLGRLCYKQAVAIRGSRGMEGALNVAVDTIIIMALGLDKCFDNIKQVVVEGKTFREVIG